MGGNKERKRRERGGENEKEIKMNEILEGGVEERKRKGGREGKWASAREGIILEKMGGVFVCVCFFFHILRCTLHSSAHIHLYFPTQSYTNIIHVDTHIFLLCCTHKHYTKTHSHTHYTNTTITLTPHTWVSLRGRERETGRQAREGQCSRGWKRRVVGRAGKVVVLFVVMVVG